MEGCRRTTSPGFKMKQEHSNEIDSSKIFVLPHSF